MDRIDWRDAWYGMVAIIVGYTSMWALSSPILAMKVELRWRTARVPEPAKDRCIHLCVKFINIVELANNTL